MSHKLNSALVVLECIMKKLNQLKERLKWLRRFIWNQAVGSLSPTRVWGPNVQEVASDLRVETEQWGD